MAAFLLPFIKQSTLTMFIEAFRVSMHKIPEHFSFPRSHHNQHLLFLPVCADKKLAYLLIVIHGFPYFIRIFKRIQRKKYIAFTSIKTLFDNMFPACL